MTSIILCLDHGRVLLLKTKGSRAIASVFAYALILDLAVASLVGSFFPEGDRWFGFFATLAFLWIMPILLSLKAVIYKTIFYFLAKNGNRKMLVREFRKAQLPLLSGTDFNEPADLYFSDVAADDSLPKPARLFAGQCLGQFAMIPSYSLPDSVIVRANAGESRLGSALI